MKRNLYWGIAILIISASVFLFVKTRVENRSETLELKREIAEKDLLLQQNSPEETNVPPVQPPAGHVREDGTFHEGNPPDPIPPAGTPPLDIPDKPKVQWTAPKEAVTKPVFPKVDPNEDPVKAAYKRLEYIKNNPYAWGGVHSPRATELIAALMTASGPIRLIDHNHGEVVIELIEELTEQGDPRGAEVLIAHMCDGDTLGPSMTDALEEIGPPAMPYILPYLEKVITHQDKEMMSIGMFDALGRIGARYSDDLGGIVQHIIIPKLQVIAADENNERYDSGSVVFAREALDRLQ